MPYPAAEKEARGLRQARSGGTSWLVSVVLLLALQGVVQHPAQHAAQLLPLGLARIFTRARCIALRA